MIIRFACAVLLGAALTVSAAAEEYKTNARGLDRRNLDFSVAPCTDFYQYANGGWLPRNPIPEDQSRWSITSEMRERNYELLREILEQAVKADAEGGTNKRKVADFWSTAMDTEAIEKAAPAPMAGDLERIGSLGSMADLQAFFRDMVRSAAAFELCRNLDKIGKPIDRNEWGMPPQTVNAYYNPVMNEIVFPAAIMQPPLFDGEIDDPVNYGAMGAVIGHEFMHGFDDKGSKFDAQGNMANWWTDEDRRLFEERAQKLVTQYGDYVAVDDLHVNGKLTLGENIGDLAGLTMAYHALKAALEKDDPGVIDGFTPEQRFFLSFAQVWRGNVRPEAVRLQVNTDPHSPAKFRVLGPLSNMPEFAEAFGCEDESPMVRSDRADIW